MSTFDHLLIGRLFPNIVLPTTDGASVALGDPGWRAVFVIRGAHCQICRAFLEQLEARRSGWEAMGIDVVVVSADPVEKSRQFARAANYHGRVACELDVEGMRSLGLWMTGPAVSTLDYVHAEPGFFLVDPEGRAAAAETSTLPSVRPDLDWLDRGFHYIVEHGVRPPFGRFGRGDRAPLRRDRETVLVTGATGYVGSVVAEKLLEAGYAVRGLTRSEHKARGLERAGVEAVVGNVNDVTLMAKAVAGVSAIVHAASPNAPEPGQPVEQLVADAARAAELLAELAAANDVRLIVTSGASIYGPTEGRVVDERARPRVPPYAARLAEVETALAERRRAHILRLGVVYGRDQSAPMRALVERVRERGAAVVDPANRLSLVHVDDLADLYVALLEAASPPPIVNGVSAITPWSEVIDAIASAAGREGQPAKISPEEARALGGPAIFMPNDMAVSGALARRLGWRPARPGLRADLGARP